MSDILDRLPSPEQVRILFLCVLAFAAALLILAGTFWLIVQVSRCEPGSSLGHRASRSGKTPRSHRTLVRVECHNLNWEGRTP
jgi:hypothetical protein